MPPNTAAVKALMPGMEPVVGMSEVLKEHRSTPAIAASAEPIAKVRLIVRFTFMPMSCAAPLSSEQARMALPILLLLVKSVSPTMMTTHMAMVSSEMPLIVRPPSETEPPTMGVYDLGLAPQSSCAAFCRK